VVDSPEHERRGVVEYLYSQAHDETVEHAEKVASERVLGIRHDVWDVHTDKDRWWVVTGLTNLYSQADFRSMDGVLTFHVGLRARLGERQAREASDRPEPRLEQTRRQWEQAAEAQNDAEEAEEFQAVGMRCRETLVSFAHAMADGDLVPPGEARPKGSDFVAWAGLVANAVAPGERNRKLRRYLKAISKEAWEYVGWLTHGKGAARFDGDVAVEVVAHALSLFEAAIWHAEMGAPQRCPNCGSYRVAADHRTDFDAGTIVHAQVCPACDWYEEREPEPLHWPGESADREPPPGDCLPSSDL
jgi:ribosomal protein L32